MPKFFFFLFFFLFPLECNGSSSSANSCMIGVMLGVCQVMGISTIILVVITL